MDDQENGLICGTVGPIINPPDFGPSPGIQAQWGAVADPADPTESIPRALSVSAGTRQTTSLACEPAVSLGSTAGRVCQGDQRWAKPFASYRDEALRLADREVALVLGKVRPPIPGTWRGPALINLPSGNLTLQIPTVQAGPLDPAPALTYNSLAAHQAIQFGAGVAELFNPTVQVQMSDEAHLISGTGQCLIYTDKDGDGRYLAPAAARNALKKEDDRTWTETQPDGIELRYDSSGALSKIVNPFGARWTITRDGDGLLTSIIGPTNRRTSYSYSGGYLAGITDAAGRVTDFDINGDLLGVTYPNGDLLQLQYDNHLLTGYTDAEGHTTQYAYDDCCRVTRMVTPEGNTYTYTYFDGRTPKAIRVLDPAANVTTVLYDGVVRTRAVVDPLGHRTSYTWNGSDDPRISSVTDPNGHTTLLTYETLDNRTSALSSIQSPKGGMFQFQYDSASRCAAITDYDGHATTLARTGMSQTIIDAAAGRFTTTYDLNGQVVSTEDPLTNFRRTRYDSNGFPIATVNEIGKRATYTYDAAGDVQTIRGPLNYVTSYTRDGLGRVLSVTNPLGNTWVYAYDADGALRRATNPELETTSYTYNFDHRLLASTNPLGFSTVLAYDSRDNQRRVANPMGEITTMIHDAANRRVTSINPLGNSTGYSFDPAGNQTCFLNPESEFTETRYDAGDRVIAVIDPLLHRTSYGYNGADLQTSVTNGEGETSSTGYDQLYRSSSQSDGLGHTTYTRYDPLSRPTCVVDPLGKRTTTVYDAAGRSRRTINPLDFITSFSYDDANRRTAVMNPEGEVAETRYDAAGRTIATIDPLNHRTSFAYDAADRQVASENAMNETNATVYDDNSRVRRTINPLGFVTSYLYDAADRRILATNPENESTATVYDANGRIRRTVNPLGFITSFSYDLADRQISVENAENEVTVTVYDDAGRTISSIDPLLRQTDFRYDNADRQIAVTNPENETTTTVYDNAGRKIATIDPLTHRTSFGYDDANRPTATINALGFTRTTRYDAAGRAIAAINPLGRRVSTVYDKADRPIAGIDPFGFRTSSVYDMAGRKRREVNPLLEITTSVYDNADRNIATIDSLGSRFTTVYDAAGRVTGKINPLLEQSATIYDKADRPIAVIDPLLNRTTTVYDNAGRVTALINPVLSQSDTIYDKADRVIAGINPNGDRVTTVYDAAGQPVATIDPLNHSRTLVYDLAGRVVRQIDPLGAVTSFVYDEAGRMTLKTNPRLQPTIYTYDNADRMLTREYIDGSGVSFDYDSADNLTSLYTNIGQIERTFDLANRVVTLSYVSQGIDLCWKRDPLGRAKASIDSSDGRTTYSYDAAGRMTLVMNPLSERTTMLYDAVGRMTEQRFADGTKATTTYDAAGRTTKVVHLSSGGSRFDEFQYRYNDAGWKTSVKELSGDRVTWTFDPAEQLTAEARSGANAYQHTFKYDAGGNRKQLNEDGEITTYVYDAANRLQSSTALTGATTYHYDANGNQTRIIEPSGDRTTRTWTSQNQLLSVRTPDDDIVTYIWSPVTLDAEERQVRRDDGFETTFFVWDGQNVVEEEPDGTGLEAKYTYRPQEHGNLISQRRDGATSIYHFDALGSTIALTQGGVVSDDERFHAFGKSASSFGTTDNPYRWNGQVGYRQDELTENYNLCQRDYNGNQARFLSEDPIGLNAGDSNFYRYVSNDPINRNDPSGLEDSRPDRTWAQFFGFDPDDSQVSLSERLSEDLGSMSPAYAAITGQRSWSSVFADAVPGLSQYNSLQSLKQRAQQFDTDSTAEKVGLVLAEQLGQASGTSQLMQGLEGKNESGEDLTGLSRAYDLAAGSGKMVLFAYTVAKGTSGAMGAGKTTPKMSTKPVPITEFLDDKSKTVQIVPQSGITTAPNGVHYDPNLVPGPNPNGLRQRAVNSPTAGEGGVYLKPEGGRTKIGSTGDFEGRYGPNAMPRIEVEIPQTRNGPPLGVDDSAYPWSARAQRRFDEEYIDRITPPHARFRASNARSPVDPEKWNKFRHIFGYGDLPTDFGF